MKHQFDINEVDTANSFCVGCKCYNSRYVLSLINASSASEIKDTAIVILKNPASTCKSSIFLGTPMSDVCDVDRTTQHLISILFTRDSYKKIITLNLFSYYDNIPATINSVYRGINKGVVNQAYVENLKEIAKIISTNPTADIYCAWGNRSGIKQGIYHKAILDVYKILKSCSNRIYMYSSVGRIKINLASLIYKKLTIKQLRLCGYLYPLHGLKW